MGSSPPPYRWRKCHWRKNMGKCKLKKHECKNTNQRPDNYCCPLCVPPGWRAQPLRVPPAHPDRSHQRHVPIAREPLALSIQPRSEVARPELPCRVLCSPSPPGDFVRFPRTLQQGPPEWEIKDDKVLLSPPGPQLLPELLGTQILAASVLTLNPSIPSHTGLLQVLWEGTRK